MNWRRRTKQFEVGDRVCYSSVFLRSIGAYSGDFPQARGTVKEFETVGATIIAVIEWGDEEIPARVNIANLSRAGEKGIME